MAQRSPSMPAKMPGQSGGQMNFDEQLKPFEDMVHCARNYAKEQPEVAALWCLGIGFVLGWRLRSW